MNLHFIKSVRGLGRPSNALEISVYTPGMATKLEVGMQTGSLGLLSDMVGG